MKGGYIAVLAYNLRHRRRDLGETQFEFAKASGVSYRMFQRLEAGSGNPTLSSLASIAKRLKIDLVELLTLRSIRTETTDADYTALCKEFVEAPFAVGIRTIEGDFLWANKPCLKLHNIEGRKFPLSSKDIISPEAGEIYKKQLVSEKLGISHSYTSFVKDSSGQIVCLRNHPILVYGPDSKWPKFVVFYASEIHSHSEEHHYHFSDSLVRCLGRVRARGQRS